MRKPKIFSLAATVCLFTLSLGCSDSQRVADRQAFLKLGLHFHEFYGDNGRSPDNLAELKEFVPRFNKPTGVHADQISSIFERIGKGEITMLWNAVLLSDGNENDKYVLAYETVVPESGGMVLRAGGSTVWVTPAEFKKMPKIKQLKDIAETQK